MTKVFSTVDKCVLSQPQGCIFESYHNFFSFELPVWLLQGFLERSIFIFLLAFVFVYLGKLMDIASWCGLIFILHPFV